MTPTERELLARLFDRIDAASAGPRDADAEALINDRVAANPGAPYRMAQTIAVQDEALKRAEERIRRLEAGASAAEPAGTLGAPSKSLDDEAAAAVPPRRSAVPSAGARPAGFGGGGFLAGAGQVALGIVGGTLLMEGIRGLTGNDGAAEAATSDPAAADQATDPAADAGADPGADAGDTGEWDTAGMDGSDGGGFLDGMFDDFEF